MADSRMQTGFYCSTSGTYFNDKNSLAEHYKSDFHRYNLKRKVAGLPPVTKDWFDARKEQLAQSTPTEGVQKVWMDPLSKKRFLSENTYQAYVQSKKYQDLLRKTGQPAPQPIITTKKTQDNELHKSLLADAQKTAGYVIKPVTRPTVSTPAAESEQDQDITSEGSEDQVPPMHDDDWETASEDEVDTSQKWDVRCSLFDNHMSSSLEANLEYMYRKFGFYLPDAEYLEDPEGLVMYLGAKLAQGHIPLYVSGDEPNAKHFRSLHGVQRHMVDTSQCRMLYDGNEEEYADFYDYSPLNQQEVEAAGQELSMAEGGEAAAMSAGGYELVVGSEGERAGCVLGNRDLARYYRQRHRPEDTRKSVAINKVLAKYRALAISTQEESSGAKAAAVKISRKAQIRQDRITLRAGMWNSKIYNLPSCVPY